MRFSFVRGVDAFVFGFHQLVQFVNEFTEDLRVFFFLDLAAQPIHTLQPLRPGAKKEIGNSSISRRRPSLPNRPGATDKVNEILLIESPLWGYSDILYGDKDRVYGIRVGRGR